MTGPDGNVWVTTSRGTRERPEGILRTYYVFTPDGEFLRQVAIRCPGDGRDDLLVFGSADRAVLVRGFNSAMQALQSGGAVREDDDEEAVPMEVICDSVRRGV